MNLPALMSARRGLWRVVLTLVLSSALVACGGGLAALLLAAPGVGSGGTGIVAGILTGLGSVVVDGVRYDDSQATLAQQDDLLQDQGLTPASLQVGQYVELTLGADSVPTRVLLDAQLVGRVAGLGHAGFDVWGQAVVVNTDPTQGPVTVYSGLGSLADLVVGDAVRVYGNLSTDDTGERLRATRIERLANESLVPARLTGSLQAVEAHTWRLAGLTLQLNNSRWQPVGAQAQGGQVVTAVGPWPAEGATAWAPSTVRVSQGSASAAGLAGQQTFSGPVRLLGGGQIQVQGLTLDASQGTLAAALAGLGQGAYVTITVNRDSATSTWRLNALAGPPASGRAVEVKGAVESWLGSSSFVVRGLAVDASRATVSGGSLGDLANGRYVEIAGVMQGNVLQASSLTLPATLPEKAVLTLTGTVQAADNSTRSITLSTPSGQVVSAQLPAGQTLPALGETVQVEGYWGDGHLLARILDRRESLVPGLKELSGVVEALGSDRFRLNGQTIRATPEQLQALANTRGQRLRLQVRELLGGLWLVSFSVSGGAGPSPR